METSFAFIPVQTHTNFRMLMLFFNPKQTNFVHVYMCVCVCVQYFLSLYAHTRFLFSWLSLLLSLAWFHGRWTVSMRFVACFLLLARVSRTRSIAFGYPCFSMLGEIVFPALFCWLCYLHIEFKPRSFKVHVIVFWCMVHVYVA